MNKVSNITVFGIIFGCIIGSSSYSSMILYKREWYIVYSVKKSAFIKSSGLVGTGHDGSMFFIPGLANILSLPIDMFRLNWLNDYKPTLNDIELIHVEKIRKYNNINKYSEIMKGAGNINRYFFINNDFTTDRLELSNGEWKYIPDFINKIAQQGDAPEPASPAR